MWRRVALVLVLSQALAGCSLGGSAGPSSAEDASPAKLRILRESFAIPRWYHRASSIAALARQFPIALVRPNAPLASDGSIDSAWTGSVNASGESPIVLVWGSGVVETISRWRCNCEATASLRDMGHRAPFRFLILRGAPAITAPSAPLKRGGIGLISRAQVAYGQPASIETVRDGYNITLYQFGAHVQPGLIAAARTLPVAHTAFRWSGYYAAGAAVGAWNGAKGFEVAPQGGATFGIGVALKNVTGKPLTITGISALNGFIRLIGAHLRPYSPPTGTALLSWLHRPYDATPERLDDVLQPNRSAAVQLDFRVRNPCIHWAGLIYDRVVEVAYTQGGESHIQEIPMVPLTITHRPSC